MSRKYTVSDSSKPKNISSLKHCNVESLTGISMWNLKVWKYFCYNLVDYIEIVCLFCSLFIATFLIPKTWLLYLCSVVLGFGSASIWTGQGNYLTLNSDSATISRNSGIFWAMLQCSMFFGNLVVTFMFQGKTRIDEHTRQQLFYVLVSGKVNSTVRL